MSDARAIAGLTTATTKPDPNRSPGVLAALLVVSTASLTGGTLAPVLIGLYVDQLKLTTAEASLVVAGENFAYAGGLLLYFLVLHRAPRAGLAAAGLLAMCVTSFMTAGAHGFATLSALRAVFGLGLGLTASTIYAAFAARVAPQRVYALSAFVNLVYAAILLCLSGWITKTWGLSGVTTVLGAASLTGLACAAAIPPARRSAPAEQHAAAPDAPVRAPAPFLPPACAAVALFCLYGGHMALWSFQERMGRAVGLDQVTVGLLLAVSVLGAILGSILSWAVGARFGSRGPNAFAYAGLLAAAVLLSVPQVSAYVAGAVLIKTAWFFGLPFLQGGLAKLDTTGRWSSVGGALLALGMAAGPAAAAAAAPYGAQSVGLIAAAFYVASFLCTLPVFYSKSARAL